MSSYFEDLETGDEWAGGEYEVTEAEIIEFADSTTPSGFTPTPSAPPRSRPTAD